MQKLYILILSIFVTSFSFAQVTVKPSSLNDDNYIYVSKSLLYIEGPINLIKNTGSPVTEASIYLREEAQLIQGSNGTSQNKGNGLLSVFQEGTSNAYDYNYWSSPVGNESTGNGLFGITMLSSPQTKTRSIPAEITTALDGTANPLMISSRWIYTFSGHGYSNWRHVGGKTEMPAGVGFSMKGVNGKDHTTVNGRHNNPGDAQRYDFRGKPNSGDIMVKINPGDHFLIGNPYPSALDLSRFLLENSGSGTIFPSCTSAITRKNAITGIAYFWDSKENGVSHYLHDYYGGYGAFSPVDPCTSGIYERPVFRSVKEDEASSAASTHGQHYDRRYLPVAQGFMVEGVANAELEFSNSHRIFRKEGNFSDFKKPASTGESTKTSEGAAELIIIPKLRLQVTINDQYIRQLTLAFWPSSTAGTDRGMDASAYDLETTDVGWNQNEDSYVIDVRPLNTTEEIPLYLQVGGTGATMQFRLHNSENFTLNDAFILDTETGVYFPIIDNTFQLSLEPGIYHNRFRFSLQDNSPVAVEEAPAEEPSIEPENPVREVVVYQNNKESQLQVMNPSPVAVSSISLYDLTGKLVLSQKDFGNNDIISLSTGNLANSIYLVKVLKKDGTVISKRVTVRNSH